ncbi:cytochrome c maturation protein CcmE [Simiduia curdlanivorans]|uniref:Cytochrome c-type biogenesis protein CcmE n=1 Tax=Simiduia curdlanivorans TaxID=1492769 RepID=A0ABV8VC47_9GAMM|nr:cytochrome c maturation protein CcmE [Simiduia curdlanivorans]MDN3639370.1 cytochrome c maturation protein CcmE [Simiduia curdlanivorans]
MHPLRKQRLMLVLFVVVFASIAVGLIVFALRENINLFYPPEKLVNGEAPIDRTIRAGGCVVPKSVMRDQSSLQVSFAITDGIAEVKVTYEGILPDLFAEGEAVVVNGQLHSDGVFAAREVLAKHDENYTPPEVADTMAKNAEKQGAEHQKTCGVLNYGS